ncbi:MAG: peptidylprolyl isomerase [Alphaproteobacteria bacterium]
MTDSNDVAGTSRASLLLWLGTLLGLGLAAYAIVQDRGEARAAMGDSVAAKVNHALISREVYESQIGRLASDKKNPMTADDRAHVLERMIEEELLIQRGVEIGLVDRNRPVRAALVQAMINAVIADTRAMEISDSALQDFYDENAAYFVRSAHLHVAVVNIKPRDGEDAAARLRRAEAAKTALEQNVPTAQVVVAHGDPVVLQVPATLLPAAKLREYVGPSLLKTALQMQAGEVSALLPRGDGFAVMRLVDVQKDAPPPLAEIRDTVAGEYRKRKGDEALRDYLEWLKLRADVMRVVDTQKGLGE